jgi:hypothetical protein
MFIATSSARSSAIHNSTITVADVARKQLKIHDRWTVDGLPPGERADITECNGTWRLLRVRNGMLDNDPREFPTAEAAFAVLVEEYADREW